MRNMIVLIAEENCHGYGLVKFIANNGYMCYALINENVTKS